LQNGGLGEPSFQAFPKGYVGYSEEVANLYPHDVAKARQLIQQAGAEGVNVTVWGHNTDPTPKAVQYVAGVLNQIGLHATVKTEDESVYWPTISTQKGDPQIAFNDWNEDYPHPLDWFDVLLNGDRITQTHNNNYANFDDPTVNSKIESLKKEPTLTASVNSQWASVDKDVMTQAPWAPYINQQGIDTFNSDMDLSCYVFNVNYQFDFATICKK